MAKFGRVFWVANLVETLERAAFYGVFVVITLYLSNVLGFSDITAAIVAGCFQSMLYLLPTFAGAYADKIGFRNSMLLAFSLLTIGYLGLALFPTILENAGLVSYSSDAVLFTGLRESGAKYGIIPILIIIVCGGCFIKSVISGTVAKETTEQNRARGFSIFYAMVNLGAFSGQVIVEPLRRAMGDNGLIVLNYFAALMTLLALLAIWFFYKSSHHAGEGKSFKEIGQALVRVCKNKRLFILILIVAGFWIIQDQIYATMPKYVIRMLGNDAAPGWYASVSPLVIVLFVSLVTTLMKRKTALQSMIVGVLVMAISALVMAAGNIFNPDSLLCGLHPIAFMMIIGIILSGTAEMFLAPRYLEYFSLQAPKGEEGLYLGFSHLDVFISSIIGFVLSGILLECFCPDPNLFASHDEWIAASSNAHYIWYVFFGVGLLTMIALIIYDRAFKHIDNAKKE